MITGFNTDVDHEGRVFHVQTEDKGLDNPVVESLIYCGGEIVASKQNPYEDIDYGEESADRVIQRLMEEQHQGMIQDIHNGKYDKEAPKPFGHNIITNRGLDEVVLEFLERNIRLEQIRLELLDEQVLHEGTRPTVRLQVIEEGTESPVEGAALQIRLISTEGDPQELFSGSSDGDGFLEASFEIPSLPGADTALILAAQAGGQRIELRQLVVKEKKASAT